MEMASESSESHLQYDEGLPPWKKELLLRKKLSAKNRPAWAPNSKYGADFHSVRNMRLKSPENSDFLLKSSDNPVKMKVDTNKKYSSKVIDKLKAEYLNSIKNIDLNGKDEDRNSDSSEELQYGPGIVNKLKSKYLSMTLRDNQKYSRPSLANLRRATSLENMLDDDKSTPKSHFIKKAATVQKSVKISQHHAKYLGISKGDSMKRARSMDALFKNDKPANGIVNEDLVIVDKDADFLCKGLHNDRELPPPDVVKQTKKIFEKTSENVERRNKKSVLSKVGNVYEPQVDRVKPMLSPKPVFGDKLPPRWPNKKIYPVVTSTTKRVTSPVKALAPRPVATAARPLPESRPVDKPVQLPVRLSVSVKPNTSAESSPLLSPVSVGSPVPVDDAVERSPDSPTRVASPVAKFYAENSLSSCFPRRNLMQATNTCLIKNQSAEPTSVKQVAVIRPIPAKNSLTVQEVENNLINTAKSIKKNSDEDPAESSDIAASDAEQVQSWEKKSWQSTNSMVFNFSSRPSVPDYIENDGLSISNRVVSKGSSNKDEVDMEEEWEVAPQFCDVSFVGDNVLINGKSNLRKEPNPNKTRRIKFNDEATTLYEYPSEDSLIEETLPPEPLPPSASPLPPSPSPSPLGGTVLSRYTPSKSPTPTDFELGVTSSASVIPQQQQQHSSAQHSPQSEDYLKPVNIDQETVWSQETTSDILF